MELRIRSSYGTLAFEPSLPVGWNGIILPGSEPYRYEGAEGNFVVQKFREEEFCICYSDLNFLKKIKLFWKEEPVLRLQYILQGILKYKGENEKVVRLRSGQLNAVWAPERETSASFSKGRYQFFQIAYRPELVQKLVPRFPLVNSFSEQRKQWIGEERTKDIYALFHSSYKEQVRRFFYETRIREHLLSYLLASSDARSEPYSEEDMERIFSVDRKILEDLNCHHTTGELARFARMPEGKLMSLFKEIVGVSMFERYKEAKLQKARKYLLETDVQIKVLYEMVGYESYTGFVEAFTVRFGLSPMRYRKKFRPFD